MLRKLTTTMRGNKGPYRLLFLFKESYWSTRNVHSTYIAQVKAEQSTQKGQQSQRHLQQLVMADAHYIDKQKTAILKDFPTVKNTVKNLFSNLSANMNSSYKCEQKMSSIGRINHKMVFQCSIFLTWPQPKTLYGYGLTKKRAELSAYIKAAEMLHQDDLMTKSGQPITMSAKDRQTVLAELNKPPTLSLPQDILEEGRQLIMEYEKEMKPLMDNSSSSVSAASIYDDPENDTTPYLEEEQDEISEDEAKDLLTGRQLNLDPVRSKVRSKELFFNLKARLSNSTENSTDSPTLPILKYRDTIENALLEKSFLIVAGDTGCGKSTQVPQMILDQWIQAGRGAECNILVTQPRRISAVSLAKRVAQERNEKVGDSVGYHVRLQYKPVSERGGIMFCTAGMLLQNLHFNPSLAGITHVILDEVHERSVQIDLLLILLRRIMSLHPELRIILMSASLSTDQLQEYLGREESNVVNVPGTLYPLTRYYLPQALSTLGLNPNRYNIRQLMLPESDRSPLVNADLVVDVVKGIENSKPPGAVLVFLPGWQDISLVHNKLSEARGLARKLWILPLHSRLRIEEQEQIFQRPPDGLRKVVLTTNIAETSLTVSDVVYVVDAGLHKEQRYNSQTDVTVLGNHWISQANGQQRAGRAGRVASGQVFHLYSQEVHDSLDKFPLPEIMKVPLEQVILQSKSYCGEERVMDFLSDGLSVPSRRFVKSAVSTLKNLGMLESDPHRDTELLTPLGDRILRFSTPPQLSKALVYAVIFRCLDAVLSISSNVTSGRGIFDTNIEQRPKTRKAKVGAEPGSDILASYILARRWQRLNTRYEARAFIQDHNLSERALNFCKSIEKVYANHLYDAWLIPRVSDDWRRSTLSTNVANSQLVLGVLLAGVRRVLHLQQGTYSKGILKTDSFTLTNEKGLPIETGSDCVLHQMPPKNLPLDQVPRHLLCVTLTRDGVARRTVARDLSFLNPLTVALFAGRSVTVEKSEFGICLSVDDNKKMSFIVESESTGMFLLKLRRTMEEVVEREIATRGIEELSPLHKHFHNNLLQYISRLLTAAVQTSHNDVADSNSL